MGDANSHSEPPTTTTTTTVPKTSISSSPSSYHPYIPTPTHCPRFSLQFLANADPYTWLEDRLSADPFVSNWIASWHARLSEPFKGITNDGVVREGVYFSSPPTDTEGIGSARAKAKEVTRAMTAAAGKLLGLLSEEQRGQIVVGDIEAREWRAWSNPELYVFRHGLRLDEIDDAHPKEEEEEEEEGGGGGIIEAIHGIMKASLSPQGYAKVVGCMKINHFLGSSGKIVHAPRVLNERSYNFSLFGTLPPSQDEGAPWGWQLTGHHCCVNVFVLPATGEVVASPCSFGAEPNVIDTGPDRGLELFGEQERIGVEVMRALGQDEAGLGLRERVRVWKKVVPSTNATATNDEDKDAVPIWRYHRADQRHLGGAFQDNRIIPYEGVLVTEFPLAAQEAVWKVIRLSLDYLPEAAFESKMQEIECWWGETWFCWIGGGFGEGDKAEEKGEEQGKEVFYYKVHSPVTMLEFDHHSGVFLTNREPRRFHVHTVVRSPNGGDYGREVFAKYLRGKEKGNDEGRRGSEGGGEDG